MSPEFVERNEVWALEQDGEVAGFHALIHQGDLSLLDGLWLLPPFIGCGHGRRLFEHATERALAAGASRMEWEAEPNAVGFYSRMGGRHLRQTTSRLGRPLEIMGLELKA